VRWVRIESRKADYIKRPVVRMKLCVVGQWIEEEVNLAEAVGNSAEEAKALGNLGNVYYSLREYTQTINYHQQHLAIVQETLEQMRRSHSNR